MGNRGRKGSPPLLYLHSYKHEFKSKREKMTHGERGKWNTSFSPSTLKAMKVAMLPPFNCFNAYFAGCQYDGVQIGIRLLNPYSIWGFFISFPVGTRGAQQNCTPSLAHIIHIYQILFHIRSIFSSSSKEASLFTFLWLDSAQRIACWFICASIPTSTRSWIPDLNHFHIIITATFTRTLIFLWFFPLGLLPIKQNI